MVVWWGPEGRGEPHARGNGEDPVRDEGTTLRALHTIVCPLALGAVLCSCATSPGVGQATARRGHGPEPYIETIHVELWLAEAVPEIMQLKPDDDTPELEKVLKPGSATFEASYVTRAGGLIRCSDSEWIFIKFYSTHGYGDFVLARDSRGDLYGCNTHVCGSLIVEWRDKRTRDSLALEDFLSGKMFVFRGKKSFHQPWMNINHWKKRKFFSKSFSTGEELIAASRKVVSGNTEEEVARILGSPDVHFSSGKGRYGHRWKAGNVKVSVMFDYTGDVPRVAEITRSTDP